MPKRRQLEATRAASAGRESARAGVLRPLLWCWVVPGWYLGLAASAHLIARNQLLAPPWTEPAAFVFVMTTASLVQALLAGGVALLLIGGVRRLRGRPSRDGPSGRIHAAVAGGSFLAWITLALTHETRSGLRVEPLALLAVPLGVLVGAVIYRVYPNAIGSNAAAKSLEHGGRAAAAVMFTAWLLLAACFFVEAAARAPGGQKAPAPVESADATGPTSDLPLRFAPLDPPLVRAGPRDEVVVLGIDGLSWSHLEPLIRAGEAPHFADLLERGVSAELATLRPTRSPRIWTTVATGRDPGDHGVLGFAVTQYPRLGIERLVDVRLLALNQPILDLIARRRRIPISSQARRVKAVWNLASEAGISVAVVGWWASWPAEPVNGFVVTDHAYYDIVDQKRADGVISDIPNRHQTYPESLRDELSAFQRPVAEATPEDLESLVNLSAEDRARFSERLSEHTPGTEVDRLRTLTLSVLSDRFFGESALYLFDRYEPDLLMMYLRAVDTFGHMTFALGAPDALERGFETAEIERYGHSMRAAVRQADRWLGRVMERMEAETTLLVLSDHGFERQEAHAGREPYGHDDAPPGLFLAIGPSVRSGIRLPAAHIRDVAPTLLYLLGLPLSDELDGELLVGAIRPERLLRHPPRHVPTFEAGAPRRRAPVASAEDEQMLENLRALGYID